MITMDCSAKDEYTASKRMPMCDEQNWGMLPFYQLMVPNESSPQKFDYLQQPYNNPVKDDVKKWITKNFADNSIPLSTVSELNDFLEEEDVNKVLLISKRKVTPPIYRVLSS